MWIYKGHLYRIVLRQDKITVLNKNLQTSSKLECVLQYTDEGRQRNGRIGQVTMKYSATSV